MYDMSTCPALKIQVFSRIFSESVGTDEDGQVKLERASDIDTRYGE